VYPLIFETSSDVSVFQVPGRPVVISRVFEFRFELMNLEKGSFMVVPSNV